MDFPADVDQWDYATIFELATGNEYEPERYDFKEILNPTKGSADYAGTHAKNISKAVCSMANGNGGYIIFGVKDPKKHAALPAEQRIVGIPRSSETLKEFGNKITDIQPNVHCIPRRRLIDLPNDGTKGIFVVHVPTSPRRPHMVEPEGIFYIRGSGGSAEPMRYYGVRDQMLYTEGRLQKIRLLRLKIEQLRKQVNKSYNGYEWEKELAQSRRYDTNSFETLLADVCDLIPAETGLLNKLLELARTANDLNIIIDSNTKFSNYHNRNTAEGERGNALAKLTGECEAELAKLFGPLNMNTV